MEPKTKQMKIKRVIVMPEMIRNEEDDGFIYPEKFQGQIIEFNDQYLHLTGNSHSAVPKVLIDRLIEIRLSEMEVVAEEYDIQEDDRAIKFVSKKIEEMMGNSFNNVNNVIDSMGEKISKTIDLKDLQTFRDQIEININKMISEGLQVANDFDAAEMKQEFSILTTTTHDLDKKVAMLNSDFKAANLDGAAMAPTPISVETVRSIVSGELEIVHSGLPGLVKSIITDQMQNVAFPAITTELVAEPIRRTLSLGQLVTLRESGYTVAEIKELKDEGLI